MNPEAQPIMPIMSESDVEAVSPQNTVAEGVESNDSLEDVALYNKAVVMEQVFQKRYALAKGQPGKLGDLAFANHFSFMGKIEQSINPKTGLQYTRDELDTIYLWHIIIGGSLASSSRQGFDMNMKWDLPGGEIQTYIDSLPPLPDAPSIDTTTEA